MSNYRFGREVTVKLPEPTNYAISAHPAIEDRLKWYWENNGEICSLEWGPHGAVYWRGDRCFGLDPLELKTLLPRLLAAADYAENGDSDA